MISLGIDPGLVATAVVAIEGETIVYCETFKPTSKDDKARSDFVVEMVLEALSEVHPDIITIEDYEYQGPRTHTGNAIRVSRLVGRIEQAAESWRREEVRELRTAIETVHRTVWGSALGITTDASQRKRLSRFSGLTPKNAHERDAASIAEYGQRRAQRRRTA